MKRSAVRAGAPLLALALMTAACGHGASGDSATGQSALGRLADVPAAESVLDAVIAADVVRCGVRGAAPGFHVVDEDGEHVGFDADFCRAVAAGVLGDATRVEFVDVETDDGLTALRAGDIDVLMGSAAWTASHDGAGGATFLHPTLYDGQAMMVAADSGFESIDDMDGAVVCVAAGTTGEANVDAEFARRGLTAELLVFTNTAILRAAFRAGRCVGWSGNNTQLASVRSEYPDGPEALVIFDDIFSKEPVTPAVVDDDGRWAQAVDWVIFATIQAEEFGLTADNVDDGLTGDNPSIVAFLGGPDTAGSRFDPGLGLPIDFAYQIVSQVGNYGEIFQRNLEPIGIDKRGLNALWSDGGLQYAPPYR